MVCYYNLVFFLIVVKIKERGEMHKNSLIITLVKADNLSLPALSKALVNALWFRLEAN